MSVIRASQRLAALQTDHPARFVLVGLALVAVAVPLVLQLRVDPTLEALLPTSAQSVRDLDAVRQRFGATGQLSIGVQAENQEALHALVSSLAPRVEAMRAHRVGAVEWSVAPLERFVTRHQLLFADEAALREVRDTLAARIEHDRAHANPLFIDLDEAPPPDPRRALERLARDATSSRERLSRFRGGFFQHPEQPLAMLFVYAAIDAGDDTRTMALVRAIEDAATSLLARPPQASLTRGDPQYRNGGVTIDFGGDLMEVREETRALEEAVGISTLVTTVLFVAAIFVFFRRWRSVPLLVLSLAPPTLVTFGAAALSIRSLNASSAFLGSIVVGNGVNSSIMWLARYFEERRAGAGVRGALAATHEATLGATGTAALGAALAYGSLASTSFRGFRDFGVIGFLGLGLCWVSAYAFLPALVVLSERWRALTFESAPGRAEAWFGPACAHLAFRSPRLVLAVCALASIASVGACLGRLGGDVLEYDFRRLQSERPPTSRVWWLRERALECTFGTRAGSLVVLAPRVDDVPSLVVALRAWSRAHPDVVGGVRSALDLVPPDQDEKVRILGEIRTLALEVRQHAPEALRAEIDAHLPPERIERVALADLPPDLARPFTEIDGTRGRLVLVEHRADAPTWDGRYLIAWSEAARSARAADGDALPVAGIAPVFADLLTALYEEGPKTIALALALTLALVMLAFRRVEDAALTLAALSFGVLWMVGIGAAVGMTVNFLNMVAFPIAFGIGVDYAVNVVKRVRQEEARGASRSAAVRAALEGAGGAVVLCSLTTIIGYTSLLASTNRALSSFGTLMVISEVTCLAAAVLALPAWMAVAQRVRDSK